MTFCFLYTRCEQINLNARFLKLYRLRQFIESTHLLMRKYSFTEMRSIFKANRLYQIYFFNLCYTGD
jgi:hypothetical protein